MITRLCASWTAIMSLQLYVIFLSVSYVLGDIITTLVSQLEEEEEHS